ncbi:MAG: UDP-N-acetylmuramoyl-L-alanyl-D-glutamate--2,6-diaminopimelate ligase [Patescibacteria group bacterium]|jgi:UDP-N-acetylmuramoyl-L-alanyl-D-glutamate--2,6-diaminopimelate ligase
MLHRLKALIPAPWLLPYHRILSSFAAALYGHPSEKLIVVGVTGTNGKTTTAYLIAKALEASGFATGCTTTALFKVGDREWLNDTKMTMLGRFQLQKLLREMVNAGCRYAVVETSSQGIAQYRHAGVNYDVAVFTNLTPEHIEAHGGFENYKRAKIDLFRHVAASKRKMIDGRQIEKVAVLNARDAHAKDFAVSGFDRTVWFVAEPKRIPGELIQADYVTLSADQIAFETLGEHFHLHLPGLVNVENALAAIAVCRAFGLDLEKVREKLASVDGMPGRFERINAGQPFTVIVDYAPEPESVARLYETISSIKRARTIHVLGSAGGGRDVARRPILGRMAAEHVDVVIVTNEDPYDDDPRQIMEDVANGARSVGKKDGEGLFLIEDRREAIAEAMKQADPEDLVLITGKGSEQAMCVAGGKKIPWDDRTVAREAIRALPKRL